MQGQAGTALWAGIPHDAPVRQQGGVALKLHPDLLKGLFKVSDSVGLSWGLRICISRKFQLVLMPLG